MCWKDARRAKDRRRILIVPIVLFALSVGVLIALQLWGQHSAKYYVRKMIRNGRNVSEYARRAVSAQDRQDGRLIALCQQDGFSAVSDVWPADATGNSFVFVSAVVQLEDDESLRVWNTEPQGSTSLLILFNSEGVLLWYGIGSLWSPLVVDLNADHYWDFVVCILRPRDRGESLPENWFTVWTMKPPVYPIFEVVTPVDSDAYLKVAFGEQAPLLVIRGTKEGRRGICARYTWDAALGRFSGSQDGLAESWQVTRFGPLD